MSQDAAFYLDPLRDIYEVSAARVQWVRRALHVDLQVE